MIFNKQDQEVRDMGYHKHAFNVLISNRLGYHRDVPDTRNDKYEHLCVLTICSNHYICSVKGIVHFEIKIWYLSAYPKGIQDVGVFFSSVDPILMFLGQTVLVCQSYNGRYRCPSL